MTDETAASEAPSESAPMYVGCTEDHIPRNLRFDVPQRNQGQTVEVAYAQGNPRARSEAGYGDEYRRTTDRSAGTTEYARRSDAPPARWGALDRTRRKIAVFDERRGAEGYSMSWHGHDRLVQVVVSRRDYAYYDAYYDAHGRELALGEALQALRGSDSRP